MNWKELKKNRWIALLASSYFLVSMSFIIWMAFFDTNSLLIHRELQQEIDKLEEQRAFLKKEIEKDKKLLKELNDPKALEKYAREKYYMKKDNEEVFLIEYEDSIQN